MNIDFIFMNILFFLIVFLVVFLVDFYVLCKEKSKGNKKRVEKMTTGDLFLISRYKLDEKKINLKKMNFHSSIINGFIISFVSTAISLINVHIGIQLAIGFVMLFGLIYAIYELYGRHLHKIWGKEEKK